MSDLIQNTINKVLDDGARASKYACIMTMPTVLNANSQYLDVICKTASIPSKMVEAIQLKYKGKTIPIIGQERYIQALDLTFYMEENHKTRVLFEKWMLGLNFYSYNENVSSDVNEIKSTNGLQPFIILSQLNFEGESETTKYIFYNVFPREISMANLDASSVDTILEYTVTFSYTHYDVQEVSSDMNGNELASSILAGIQDAVNSVVKGITGEVAKSLGINDKASSANDSLTSAMNSISSGVSSGADYIGTTLKDFLK